MSASLSRSVGEPRIMKRILSRAETVAGVRIYSASQITERGIDVFSDLATYLPHTRIGLVFDVGGNVGQSAQCYAQEFPGAVIHTFEPVASTFAQLKRAVPPRVQCHQLGFGAVAQTANMVKEGSNDMFYLLGDKQAPSAVALEPVTIDTVDAFCARIGVSAIDFLKIDTEGYDLEVLRGAAGLLQQQKISIIQVEASMNCDNDRHVPFGNFMAFLEPLGYRLFGIYEQCNEWPTREPHLRRTNPVFISQQVIAANRRRRD